MRLQPLQWDCRGIYTQGGSVVGKGVGKSQARKSAKKESGLKQSVTKQFASGQIDNSLDWRAGRFVSTNWQSTIDQTSVAVEHNVSREMVMLELHPPTPRFVRRTVLAEGEYNRNFEMLDRDVLAVVSSAEADAITPLMSKIYLRLRQVPDDCRESGGVLRFAGEEREGKWVKAWTQLCRHLRVSSETASKALRWLHQQGVIGYSAFKNGVGIRIFLNRAASSIANKPQSGRQKFLPAAPASLSARHA